MAYKNGSGKRTTKRMKRSYSVRKYKELPKVKNKGNAKAPGTIKRSSM